MTKDPESYEPESSKPSPPVPEQGKGQESEVAEDAVAVIYDVDDIPSPPKLIAFGFQHVVVAFAAMIGVPLAFAGAVGLDSREEQILVSGVLIAGGIATMVQALGLGPFGARLPIINAATFKFIGPMVVAYKAGGFPALYGAALISGLITSLVGFAAGPLRRIFTPFLIGCFLLVIGASLMPIGFKNLLSLGQPTEGDPIALFIGLATLIIIAILNCGPWRVLRPVAILIGFSIGYALAAAFGLINWDRVSDAKWFGIASPFELGTPSWPGISVLIAMLVVYLATVIETVGDSTAVAGILNRKPTSRQLRGALIVDGLGGPLSGLANGLPMTTYGQNVGLVRLTGVGSRYVVATGGALLIIFGIIPKIAALVASMPAPVLGAGLIMTFGMIFSEGVRKVGSEMGNPRNAVVISIALGPAIGLHAIPPELLNQLPETIRPLLSDAMVAGLIAVIIAYFGLPGRRGSRTP